MDKKLSKEEIIKLLDIFRKNLFMRKDSLQKKYNWPNKDTRIAIFTKCSNGIDFIILSYTLRCNQLEDNNWWTTTALPLHFNIRDKSLIIEEYEKSIKRTLIHFTFSAIESSLRTILKNVDSSACSNGTGGFYCIYDTLLKTLNLQKHKDIFNLASNVRNTIHNNSFYFPKTGGNQDIPFKGKDYKFEVGKRINFASEQFIIDLFEEILNVIVEIIESEEVSQKDEIIDPLGAIN